MKARTKSLWIGLCGILSAGCLTAGVFASNSMVNVSAATSISTNLTMVAGASARKTEGEPGIKFTAELSEYKSSVTYGMLILPESAFGLDNFEGRYHAYFAENNITKYADITCNPYRLDVDDDGVYEDQWYISASLTDINTFNYDMSFVGVAYEKIDGVYSYAVVDEVENGRSIAYVAQMALKYEENLTDEQRAALEDFTDVGAWLEKDSYFTDEEAVLGGDTSGSIPAEYAMKYNFNVGETVNLITKNSYAAGTEVSFEYYIPAGTVTSWWGMAWHSDASKANNYHAAGAENAEGHYALSSVTGSWTSVSFTLSSAGYLYFGAEVGANHGRWQLDGKNSYALFKNFTIGGEAISFADLGETFADTYKAVASSQCIQDATIGFGSAPEDAPERAAKYILNTDGVSFMTKEAYAGGTTVSFKYYFPVGSKVGGWWGVAWHTNPASANIYHAAGIEGIGSNYKALGAPVVGEWTEVTFTLTAGGPYYLYFGSPVGDWKLNGEDGYVLFDDFQIGEVTENFNDGIENNKMFNVLIDGAVVSSANGEGYVAEAPDAPDAPVVELGEVAMKYNFNVAVETATHVTKQAYAGGSTVSFKYYIPAGTPTSWWGLSWNTANTGLSIYSAADTGKAKVIQGSQTTTGAWTEVIFTLPSGGPYYLYFGSEISSSNWKLNGQNSYMLIDEFTVNDEKETFNYGVANSAFEVLYPGAVVDSEVGEGYVAPRGEYGAKIYGDKISSTATTPTFITKVAYTFETATTVTFDYYMSGNTNKKWWILAWTNNQKTADIYAHVGSNKENNDGRDLPTNVQDAWATASVEVPAGTWYFYIAMAKGEWSGGHVIIDNFKIGDQVTEDFSYGISDSIFVVSPFSSHHSAVELADGYVEPVPEPQGVKIQINNISEKGQSFVTSSSYAGGGTITFDYYTYNPANNWWSICWSESKSANNTSTTIYAHTGSYAGCGGKELPKVQGSWETVTVEVPEGNWYFYIGGAKGSWSDGYVILDNVVIKDASGKVLSTENFDNGYGIFENRRTSDIFLVEGKPADVEPEVPEVPETPVLPESEDKYALVNLLANGSIVSYLNEGGYASIFSNFGGELSVENIPASMLYMEGYISYLINGEKEFAIYFGNGSYLFVNGSMVALYNGTELVNYYEAVGVSKLAFTITAGGKLNVKMDNGAYVGMGIVDAASISGIKLVALGGAGSVTFTDIEIEAYKCIAVDVPVYLSEEGIDVTAYAFDNANVVSDMGFAMLSEAGFTKTLALLQGRVDGLDYKTPSQAEAERLMTRVNADALAALELAEKYGMKHYVFNEPLYNLERQTAWYDWVDELKDLATYTLSEAFAGHFLADEPESGKWFTDNELKELVNAYKAYRQAFPEGEAFINLLPIGSSQFTSESYYTDYVDYYIQNIALDKDGVKGTGYVSFDHYPLEDSKVSSTHLRNLEIIAERCRDNNLELRFYIKASTTGDSGRDLRGIEYINDLYMQIYSGLAYGGKEVIYYQYTDHTMTDGTAGDGVLGGNLQPGNVYNWAKQANNEIHAFEKAYMNFTWKSASVFGATSLTQFNNLKSKAGKYGYISSVSSSASILVGNFDDADGKYTFGAKNAYMVVNYGNTGSSQAASDITITFNGMPKRAIVYQQGEMEVVTLNGNNLTLNLMLGEGAFVIPLTNAR